MRNRFIAYLQLTAAMITVGSTVVASNIIGRGIDPFLAAALRFAIALPIQLALLRATGTALPRPSAADAMVLITQAATGSVGYTILLIAGTSRTSAADAGIIIGTLPAVASLTAAIALRERLQKATILAVLLATAGVLLATIGSSGHSGGARSLPGDGLVLLAVICESLFILLNKRLSQPWPPLALATAMTGLGLVISLALAIPQLLHAPAVLPMRPFLGVLYYALVPTVLGFWLWYAGASQVSGGEAAIFTAVAPVSGVALSALVLSEPLTPVRLGGLALVVAAVVFTTGTARVSRRFHAASPQPSDVGEGLR